MEPGEDEAAPAGRQLSDVTGDVTHTGDLPDPQMS